MVQPTTFFGFRSYKSAIKNIKAFDESTAKADGTEAVKGCSSYVDPTCLSNLYDFADADDYTSGLMGVGGFL